MRPNVFVAADSNHGYKMIAVGREIARVLGGEHSSLLHPFRYERFQTGDLHPVSHSPYPISVARGVGGRGRLATGVAAVANDVRGRLASRSGDWFLHARAGGVCAWTPEDRGRACRGGCRCRGRHVGEPRRPSGPLCRSSAAGQRAAIGDPSRHHRNSHLRGIDLSPAGAAWDRAAQVGRPGGSARPGSAGADARSRTRG